LDVDIIVTQNGSFRLPQVWPTYEGPFMMTEHKSRFYINPGSATGVGTTPSFVLMDINGSKVVFYIYRLVEEQVKVDKLEWTLNA
jgi:hypothetical protein